MLIKIYCECGTKFSFDVEPVDGHMPMNINCPGCNASAMAMANNEITRQLAAASLVAPAEAPPPVQVSSPASPRPLIRVSQAHNDSAPAAEPHARDGTPLPAEAAPETRCPKHAAEVAAETCTVCGKPICLKCMEQFGYLCSVLCRRQAEQKRMNIPVYAQQRDIVAAKSRNLARVLVAASVFLIAALLGLWIWYAWFAREPKIVYSVALAKDSGDLYQLAAPGQVIAIKGDKLSLFDLAAQRQIWTAALPAELPPPRSAAGDDKSLALKSAMESVWAAISKNVAESEARIWLTSNDVWVFFPDRAARYDLKTGSSKEIPFKARITSLDKGGDSVVAVTETDAGQKTVVQLNLLDGTAQSEEIIAEKPKPAVRTRPTNPNSEAAQTDDQPRIDRKFLAAGANAVEFVSKLIEVKYIYPNANAAPANRAAMIDDQNITAGQGMQAAAELARNARAAQKAGERQDVSRFQVTLHRRFASGVSDWSGEVVGPPQFFPFKNIDALAAGQSLQVFDKNNRKLWETKLAAPVDEFPSGAREEFLPGLNTGDALYFADSGNLTKFDAQSGALRWTTVAPGVSRIQSDQRGMLYVTTVVPANGFKNPQPFIVKLDPANGNMLWRSEYPATRGLLDGKFVYSARGHLTYDVMRLEEGPDTTFLLSLLSPSDGKEIWRHSRTGHTVSKVDVRQNWILLQFDDSVQVLKFFSL